MNEKRDQHAPHPTAEGTGNRTDGAAGALPVGRRRAAPWFFGGLVLLLLTVLVAQQVSGLWEFVAPDSAADTLVLYALSTLNFVAFIVFSFIFVRSLLKLRRERRARELGSRIKTRLVVYFIAVSLLPITAMAVFSYLFFNRTLEKMFGRVPEDVVSEARLARDEDATQQAQVLQETARLAALAVKEQLVRGEAPNLGALLDAGNFDALGIAADKDAPQFSFSDANVASARNEKFARPLREAAARAQGGAQGAQLVFSPEGVLAVAVPLGDGRTLLAARATQADTSLAHILSGAEKFEQLRKRQRKIRLLGLSTLGLLTLLLLFAATWAAIHLARGIGTPIRTLAEAADEVARGNLAHRVAVANDDELGVLADAFNQMTAQLEENRRRIESSAAELRDKNLALDERRHYIETVLESLSTGVVSLDADNCLTTINAAAAQMLRPGDAPAPGTPLAEIVSPEDRPALERVLARARRQHRAAWQMELTRGAPEGGALPVALTATAFGPAPGQDLHTSASQRGVVLVIEDLTELLAAQRAAAWSEVARRMAHEIKNPLTPIQLSAERIARNLPRVAGTSAANAEPERAADNDHSRDARFARIVAECTQTITREVAGLKAMVDEFSRFARLPRARPEPTDLNEVVRQAVALYEDRLDGVRLDVRLAPALPMALLDAEQVRRALVNLIDNAREALADLDPERRITVATGHDPGRGLLLVEVADTGHGISRADFSRLFQPYFSTRGRGTGLGLAIVQRIVTDHGGRIRAESNRPRGARFTVELPVAEEPQRSEVRGQRPEEEQPSSTRTKAARESSERASIEEERLSSSRDPRTAPLNPQSADLKYLTSDL